MRRLALRRSRSALPRRRRRRVLVVLPLAILLGAGFLWLRDSSLVSVRRVVVQVDPGPDAGHIRQALVRAARNMTTLDVRVDQLRTAVAPYPLVRDLQVSSHFPHGLRIRVLEHVPVAALTAGGRPVAVAGDGTLLRDVSPASLPSVPVRVPPGGTHLNDPAALGAVKVLAAAPAPMLAHISEVTRSGGDGWVAQLRSGPSLRFGEATQLKAKWSAAVAVLADPGSAGAAYIDLSDPARPAAAGSASGSGSAVTAGASGSGGGAAAGASGPSASATTSSTGG